MERGCSICRNLFAEMPPATTTVALPASCPDCRRVYPGLRRCPRSTAGAVAADEGAAQARASAAPKRQRHTALVGSGQVSLEDDVDPDDDEEKREPVPKRQKNSSAKLLEFVGVTWHKQLRKWVAQIAHDGKKQHLGCFDDEREAARAVDTAARRLRGENAHGGRSGNNWYRLNFPTEAEVKRAKDRGALLTEEDRAAAAEASERQGPSVFMGVSWAKRQRNWKAQIRHDGKHLYLGYFDDEREAARAVDTAARRLRGENAHGGRSGNNWYRLNFPTEAEIKKAKYKGILQMEEGRAAAAAASERQGPSEFLGVSWKQQSHKWVAQMWHDGRTQHLGYSDDEQEAAQAVDTAARLRGDDVHGGRSGTQWHRPNFPTKEEVNGAGERDALLNKQDRAAAVPQQPQPAATAPQQDGQRQYDCVANDLTSDSGNEDNMAGQPSPGTRAKAAAAAVRSLKVPDGYHDLSEEEQIVHESGFYLREKVALEEVRRARELEIQSLRDKHAKRQALAEQAHGGLSGTHLRGPDAHSSKFKLNFPMADEETNLIQRTEPSIPAKRPTGEIQTGHPRIKREDQSALVGYFNSEEEEVATQADDTAAQLLRRSEPHGVKTKLSLPTAEQTWLSQSAARPTGLSQNFIGVSWNKGQCKWAVSITHEKRRTHVGYFKREEQEAAARAYDYVARQLRGPDAHSSRFTLNFPTVEEQRNQSQQEETGTTQRSKFTGVHWDKRGRTWVVKISHEGQNQHVGCFAAKQEEAAARAYDYVARQLRGPDAHSSRFTLNFPTVEEQRNQSQQEETGTTQRSKFTGVYWDKRGRTWVVKISHEGQNQHVGCFAAKQEEAAARAYDYMARQLRGPDAHSSRFTLNFPTVEEQRNRLQHQGELSKAAVTAAPLTADPIQSMRSSFTGVNWNKSSGRWLVQIMHEKQYKYVGKFSQQEEQAAARAYDNAARELRGSAAHSSTSKLNFPTPEEVRNRAPAVKVPALLNSETMQSRFIGVSWRTKRYANIKGQQGNRFLGGFAHEEEETAARAYDAAARQLRGPEAHGSKFQLNFPTADERMNCIAAGSSKSHTLASRFIGVHKKNGKLVVKISNEGQNMNVGYFAAEQEEAAARAYDAAARQLRGPEAHSSKFKLNFPTPEEERNRPQLAPAAPQTGTSRAETNQQSPRSQFIGVNRNKRDSKWRVSVWHEGRNQQVG
jgi:hypothetical protein